MRGKKGTEFEGGMRVPFIVGWAKPEKKSAVQKHLPIEAGGIQMQLGTIMDIYPTVLSVAGCEVPQNYVIDGFDLKRQLSGKADRKRPESFLMHFPHAHRGSYFTTYRLGDWKLIYYYSPETPKQPKALLYNLKDDPEERKELSSTHPDKCREMIQETAAQLEKEGALYPVDKQGNELKPFVCF